MANRPIQIDTSAGEDLLFWKLRGTEELGRPFELEVDLLSDNNAVKLTDVIHKPMAVHLELEDATRFFHGIVSRFGAVGAAGRRTHYRATLRPRLWFLTRRVNCRVFQNATAPDIIKDIFREHGLSDFSESLNGTYRSREYCVQYRESDFAFISRLMEQEGIYYYFKHEKTKHTLVLADSSSAHEAYPGFADINYYPKMRRPRGVTDGIDAWAVEEQLEPGAVFLQDFDFLRPTANLQAKLASRHTLAKASLEVFDYPGDYTQAGDGETYAKVRLEELYAQQAIVTGEGDARGIATGHTFTVAELPRADQNAEHLVISTCVELSTDAYESDRVPERSALETEPVFRVGFRAIRADRPFRPARVTPRPVIQGPQTAIVVGKANEEIWTDEHGRVKLQFHWDRVGQSDENSSCWVRVAQIWAGGKWGSIHIPRIGQEVLVEFLEGDPDRPLVTGRVYNGDNKPPYVLPGNKTQSGIKSRSSKQAGEANFNELRFEDLKGSEQVFLQAEKDLEINVKNDEKHTVGRDRTKEIKRDEKTKIGNDRTEEVVKNEKITIGENRTESVGKDEKIEIKGARTETVAKDESITISGARTEKVSKDETVTIEGARSLEVKKDETIKVTGKRNDEVGGDETVKVSGKRTVSVTGEDKLTAQKLTIEGQQEVVLKSGAASITIKASGDIIIKGVNVTIDGPASIKIKGAGPVDIMGMPISLK